MNSNKKNERKGKNNNKKRNCKEVGVKNTNGRQICGEKSIRSTIMLHTTKAWDNINELVKKRRHPTRKKNFLEEITQFMIRHGKLLTKQKEIQNIFIH